MVSGAVHVLGRPHPCRLPRRTHPQAAAAMAASKRLNPPAAALLCPRPSVPIPLPPAPHLLVPHEVLEVHLAELVGGGGHVDDAYRSGRGRGSGEGVAGAGNAGRQGQGEGSGGQ